MSDLDGSDGSVLTMDGDYVEIVYVKKDSIEVAFIKREAAEKRLASVISNLHKTNSMFVELSLLLGSTINDHNVPFDQDEVWNRRDKVQEKFREYLSSLQEYGDYVFQFLNFADDSAEE